MKAKERNIIRKPFYVAGVASIVLIFLGLIANVLILFLDLPIIGFVYSIVAFVSVLLVIYGFYILGKRYNSKLLSVLSILAMISLLIGFFSISLFGSHLDSSVAQVNKTIEQYNQSFSSLNYSNISTQDLESMKKEFDSKVFSLMVPFLVVFVSVLFLYVIYSVLWGIALIKLKDKVRYAKVAGILNIVGALTLFFYFGAFVLLAAFVFEILILFDQAKKFKEIK
jgi:hypothetical protein